MLTFNGAISSSNFYFLFFLASYSRDASVSASCINGRSFHIPHPHPSNRVLSFTLKSSRSSPFSSFFERACFARPWSFVPRARSFHFVFASISFFFAHQGRSLKKLLAAGLERSLFRSNRSIYMTN